MINEAEGVLAIWNDVRDGRAAEFEFWYNNEHFPERLAVPGFRLGRRYEAIVGGPRYFCFYLADTTGALTSPAYMERLNNPTRLTRSIMTQAFANMIRTVCRRSVCFGRLWGAVCVTARLNHLVDRSRVLPLLEQLAAEDGIAHCELWTAQENGGMAAVEERLRGGDRKIAACIVVDTLRPSDAERVHSVLLQEFGATAETGVYQLLCEITRATEA